MAFPTFLRLLIVTAALLTAAGPIYAFCGSWDQIADLGAELEDAEEESQARELVVAAKWTTITEPVFSDSVQHHSLLSVNDRIICGPHNERGPPANEHLSNGS